MRARWTGLALLVLLTACGGSGGTAAPSPTGSAQPSPTAAPVQFRTADGNIGCTLEARHVVCDIGAHSWKPPARPAQCRSTWAEAMQFTIYGHPTYLCGQTSSSRGATRVLGADETVRVSLVACHAVPGGVRCFGDVHGYLLSRTESQLF
jgi:hypothetical protein